MNQPCQARGCEASCDARPMCPKHWRLVSAATQRLIYKHHYDGRGDDDQPSAAYQAALARAISEAAAAEHQVDPRQLNLLGE